MTTSAVVELDEARAGAFVERMFGEGIATANQLCVYLGDRLGLYRALADGGPATSTELAARTGVDERYAREWLEQQASNGILEVDDVGAEPTGRRFTLPAEHAVALVDPESPFSISPLSRVLAACGKVLPAVLEAFRTGHGVPWSTYGDDGVQAQGDFNRPWLLGDLAATYLPAIPDVHERLQADPPARVADVACGVGWASIAIARAYPNVAIEAFDADDASIALARHNAAAEGLDGRVSFEVRNGAEIPSGRYDVAIVVEAIHDMSNPVEVLTAIRRSLRPGGTAIVADERTAETFQAPGDPIEQLLYSASVLVCLPTGLSEQPSAATGTVMRPSTLRTYAHEAGFTSFEILEDLEHPMLRFYRLNP